MSPDVVDDREGQQFVIEGDGAVSRLDYRVRGERLILVHTEVPEEQSGRGIGGRLVRAAVERAAREGLVVVPRCPFARTWLEEHPNVAATATIDWTPPTSHQGPQGS